MHAAKKILFIAMSGVRVRDPELLALGLTLPGFVDCLAPKLILAAHTPSSWREYNELPENRPRNLAPRR